MKYVTLKHALTAAPTPEDFHLDESVAPECPEGGILVEVKFISIDPYVGARLRGKHMGEPAPVPKTEMIPGAIVGTIIESRADGCKKGDYIHSMEGGWAEICALHADEFRVIDTADINPSAYLGVLGMPGLTAWAGVTQLARIQDGDIFAVNAAAGPVGGTAGQIARLKGAKTVIGIAGSAAKCKLVENTYGFDACLNYKTKDWQDKYKLAAPDGISVHFENVGSEQLAWAMQNMQLYGRVVLCGLAAHYHTEGPPATTAIGMIVGKRAILQGLVVYDFYARWADFHNEVTPWVREGALKFTEDTVKGLGNAPKLMHKLMTGKNIGKCVVAL